MHKLRYELSHEAYLKDKRMNKLGVHGWGNIVHFFSSGIECINDELPSSKIKDFGEDKLGEFHDSIRKDYSKYLFDKKIQEIRALDTLAFKVLENISQEYS